VVGKANIGTGKIAMAVILDGRVQFAQKFVEEAGTGCRGKNVEDPHWLRKGNLAKSLMGKPVVMPRVSLRLPKAV
jgi:hypothetical protein